MTSTEEIKNKEVINIFDGRSLGYVSDIEINLEEGRIEGLVIQSPKNFFNILFLSKTSRLPSFLATISSISSTFS